MSKEIIECDGRRIRDKHTHYELSTFVGPQPATIIITGDVAKEFQKTYGQSIRECERFYAELDFARNDELVRECQDVFQPPGHLRATLRYLDQISLEDIE